MNEITQHPIKHLASITVCGSDTLTFLQGQCTQDIKKIPSFGALPGAFCSAKGRVVSNVLVHRVNDSQDDFELLCHASSAALLYDHLKKYVPFFRGTKMSITSNAALNMVGYIGTGDRPGFKLNDLMSLELNSPAINEELDTAEQWLVEEIKQGVLWLDEHQFEQWIAQNINLDSLNAVSFTKGCYTGQEVVARLHYKGSSKKRLYAVRATDSMTTSQSISANGKTVGNLLQCAHWGPHSYGLAVIKTDATEGPLFITENEQLQLELLHSF